MIKLCRPPIRLLLGLCPIYMDRLSNHLPPMPPVLQMELDIGYLVKAAPLAPAVGIDKLPHPLHGLAAVVYDQWLCKG